MKKLFSLFMSLFLASAPSVPAPAAETQTDIWMYALSVGKADAILLSVDGHTALIDTGYNYSRGRILAGMKEMGVEKLDAVFVTHLDNDHTGGLMWLAESDLEIGAWYASAMYTGIKKESKHDAVQAAAVRGEKVQFLQAGDQVLLGGALLKVLAPTQLMEDKDDNNSLVMMLESSLGRILLTGDIEYPAEQLLMNAVADLKCDVLKVANHADNDTNSPAFTQRTSPAVAVISTSGAEKPDTPDPRVVRMLQEQGAAVYVTEACTGGVLVRLTGGTPEVTLRNVPESETKASLIRAVPGDDLITLRCESGTGDLSGWVLASDKGKEMYVFPEGTQLQPGSSLTIGTKSSPQGSWDLLWDEKKVVNAKKEDIFTLYDAVGTRISSVSNGL